MVVMGIAKQKPFAFPVPSKSHLRCLCCFTISPISLTPLPASSISFYVSLDRRFRKKQSTQRLKQIVTFVWKFLFTV